MLTDGDVLCIGDLLEESQSEASKLRQRVEELVRDNEALKSSSFAASMCMGVHTESQGTCHTFTGKDSFAWQATNAHITHIATMLLQYNLLYGYVNKVNINSGSSQARVSLMEMQVQTRKRSSRALQGRLSNRKSPM